MTTLWPWVRLWGDADWIAENDGANSVRWHHEPFRMVSMDKLEDMEQKWNYKFQCDPTGPVWCGFLDCIRPGLLGAVEISYFQRIAAISVGLQTIIPARKIDRGVELPLRRYSSLEILNAIPPGSFICGLDDDILGLSKNPDTKTASCGQGCGVKSRKRVWVSTPRGVGTPSSHGPAVQNWGLPPCVPNP